jgi:hypothetical protein
LDVTEGKTHHATVEDASAMLAMDLEAAFAIAQEAVLAELEAAGGEETDLEALIERVMSKV